MPQRRNAIKELRKNHTRHMRNLDIKTDLKKTIKSFVSTTAQDKTKAVDLLDKVGLSDRASHKPNQLSGEPHN